MQKSVNHNSKKVTFLSVIMIVIGLTGLFFIARFQEPLGQATLYNSDISIIDVTITQDGVLEARVYTSEVISAYVSYSTPEWVSCGKVMLTKGYTLVQCPLTGKPLAIKVESAGKTVMKEIY